MVCKTHADLLENLNNDNDNDNRYQHDREIIAVIAVVYSYGTQTAATDKACHCGIAEDGNDRNRAADLIKPGQKLVIP